MNIARRKQNGARFVKTRIRVFTNHAPFSFPRTIFMNVHYAEIFLHESWDVEI